MNGASCRGSLMGHVTGSWTGHLDEAMERVSVTDQFDGAIGRGSLTGQFDGAV